MPKTVRLTADRPKIHADRNDLSYVAVKVVDAARRRVLNAAISVRFTASGAGELTAQGSSAPNEPANFRHRCAKPRLLPGDPSPER